MVPRDRGFGDTVQLPIDTAKLCAYDHGFYSAIPQGRWGKTCSATDDEMQAAEWLVACSDIYRPPEELDGRSSKSYLSLWQENRVDWAGFKSGLRHAPS